MEVRNLFENFRRFNEATEERDREYRQKALDIWQEIKDFLDENEGKKKFGLIPFKIFPGSYIYPKFFYKKLIVAFLAEEHLEKEVAGGYSSLDPYKILLIPVLKERYDTEFLNTRWIGAKSTFVHEIIHFFDDMRYEKDVKTKLPNLKKRTKKQFQDYFNSPQEFNAYYQEGAFSILNSFKGLYKMYSKRRPEVIRERLSSYENFMSFYSDHWDSRFVENIKTSKYWRKFQKRTLNLYRWIKDKYSKDFE